MKSISAIGKIFLIAAAAVIVVGIVFLCVPALGLNTGADFSKTYSIEISYRDQFEYNQLVARAQNVLNNVKDDTGKAYPGFAIIKHQKLGTAYTGLTLKIFYKGIPGADMDTVNKDIVDALKADLIDSEDPFLVQVLDAAEVTQTGIMQQMLQAIAAMALAAVGAIIYILFRHKLGNTLAAFLVFAFDLLSLLSITAITRIQVNFPYLAIVAALIGLSFINSVILFNRVKENSRNPVNQKLSGKDIVEISVKQSFWVVALTSAVTLAAGIIFAFAAIFGGAMYLWVGLPLVLSAVITFLDWLFILPNFTVWFWNLNRSRK